MHVGGYPDHPYFGCVHACKQILTCACWLRPRPSITVAYSAFISTKSVAIIAAELSSGVESGRVDLYSAPRRCHQWTTVKNYVEELNHVTTYLHMGMGRLREVQIIICYCDMMEWP